MTTETQGTPRDPHVPGVPQCPDCGSNYVLKSGEASARRDGRPYWVANCSCMRVKFDRLLAEGKLKPMSEGPTAD